MYANRAQMLRDVMAADFFCYDLALYLDTHPCDKKALCLYAESANKAKMLRECYEKQFGPLTAQASKHDLCKWRWIEDPWPWQRQ
ncbi:MAG TPA: spore coat protein CotJB [Clostridia bacterium]